MAEGLRIDRSHPVLVVEAGTSVGDALRVLREHHVRHLPVVSRGLCVGLAVDVDLIAAAVDGVEGPVGRYARRPAPTVPHDADPRTTARAILEGGLDAAVVVDGGAVVGIVTATDVLVALAAVSSLVGGPPTPAGDPDVPTAGDPADALRP